MLVLLPPTLGLKNYFSFLAMHYAVEAVAVSNDESNPKAPGASSKGAVIIPPPPAGPSQPTQTFFADFTVHPPEVVPPDDEMPLLVHDQCLLMAYHECFGHLSWDMLKVLANQRIIPPQLSKCPVPKCPGCIYGKMHHQPWHSKVSPNKIKPTTQPGAVVSVDQLISTTVGLIPQG